MSIIKVHHPRQYVTICMKTAEDTDISLEAKGLHMYLLSRPPNWQVNVTHLRKVVKNAGRDKIYRILDELVEAGYCDKTRADRSGGQFGKWNYDIYESKDRAIPENQERSITENLPLTENQEVVDQPENWEHSPVTENQEVVPNDPLPENTEVVKSRKGEKQSTRGDILSDSREAPGNSALTTSWKTASGFSGHIINNKLTKKPLSPNTGVSDRSQGQQVTSGGGEREILSDEKNNNPQSSTEQPPEHDQKTPEPVASSKPEQATPSPELTHQQAFEAAAPDREAIGEPPHGVIKPIRGEKFIEPGWLHELWQDWVDHRESLKPYTEIQKFFDCGYLANFVKAGWGQAEVFENSISRGFARLHPPCPPGKEKETLEARRKLAEQNKSESNGNGAGVGVSRPDERLRDARQEVQAHKDRLKMVPVGSKAAEHAQAQLDHALRKLERLGGGHANNC